MGAAGAAASDHWRLREAMSRGRIIWGSGSSTAEALHRAAMGDNLFKQVHRGHVVVRGGNPVQDGAAVLGAHSQVGALRLEQVQHQR